MLRDCLDFLMVIRMREIKKEDREKSSRPSQTKNPRPTANAGKKIIEVAAQKKESLDLVLRNVRRNPVAFIH